jgi:sugar lactone lactonase YvrE
MTMQGERAVEPAEIVVAAGCALAEGPLWRPATATLHWVDIERPALWTHATRTGETRHVDLDETITAVVATTDGALVATTGDRAVIIDPATGERETLAAFGTDASMRANDAKVDPQGRLWAGVMRREASAGTASLRRLDPGGRWTTVLDGLALPNGLDWSPDGETMYFVDSLAHGLDAYPFDPATGALGAPRRLVDVPEDEGLLDGLCVDADGCVWVALAFGGQVRRYAPDGTLLTTLRVPASVSTCCAFGGAELDVLFVTSGTVTLTDAERAAQPAAGAVFALRPGVAGRSTNLLAIEGR